MSNNAKLTKETQSYRLIYIFIIKVCTVLLIQIFNEEFELLVRRVKNDTNNKSRTECQVKETQTCSHTEKQYRTGKHNHIYYMYDI